VVWLNVGRREKRLLFLLRERDEPAGRPIAIRDAVCREFKIHYDPYLLKSRQREAVCEERRVKRAFERLFKNGFVVPVWALREGFSLVPLGGRVDFGYCILTEKGRLVVERLKRQEQFLKVEEDTVARVLGQFRDLDYVYVTVEQFREGLWLDSFHGFVDRVAFDRYWNNTKLGKVLQQCAAGWVRIGRKNRHRKYRLM
jgi:hypothetical protein